MTLTDQQSIVTKLNAVSAETKRLEGIYQQKLNDLEELKKSILQQANHDGNHDFTTTLFVMKRNFIEFNSIFSITRQHGKKIR
jgi:hypothetical protein